MRRVLRKLRRRLRGRNDPRAWMQGHIDSLREAGMTIGENVTMFECDFDHAYPFLITIGDRCSLGAVQILCHDDSSVRPLGRTTVAPVVIEDDVFVGHRAMILAGVTVGAKSIVGAGSVVARDVLPGSVVVGNPAKVVGRTDELLERRKSSSRLVPYDLPNAHITGVHRDRVIEAARKMYP